MMKIFFKILLHFIAFHALLPDIGVLGQKTLLPPNACPDYFKYNNGVDGQVEGQIGLKFKITDSDVNLVFQASVPGTLTSVSL